MNYEMKPTAAGGLFLLVLVLGNAIILSTALTANENWYWALCVSVPLLIFKLIDMKKNEPQLVVRKDDYEVLVSLLKTAQVKTESDRRTAEELQTELKRAKLVSKEEFPEDVIRINSKVKIREENKDNIIEVELVTPDKADIKEKKISVMAPIGTALIGFRKGQKVKWQVPAGNKTFLIMDVLN